MNFGEFIDGKAQQPLPPSLVNHEEDLAKFHKYCHDMMLKILKLFSIGLEVNNT
jgi:isopenicillin N synthase-like dioxygenase